MRKDIFCRKIYVAPADFYMHDPVSGSIWIKIHLLNYIKKYKINV